MPTQQPRAINKNNRSSSETVELLRVWHRQEFPSVYAIQSQASSEECSDFFRGGGGILFPINLRKADSYNWSRGGSGVWKRKIPYMSRDGMVHVLSSVMGANCSEVFPKMRHLLKSSFVFRAFYVEHSRRGTAWLKSAIKLSLEIILYAWKSAQMYLLIRHSASWLSKLASLRAFSNEMVVVVWLMYNHRGLPDMTKKPRVTLRARVPLGTGFQKINPPCSTYFL